MWAAKTKYLCGSLQKSLPTAGVNSMFEAGKVTCVWKRWMKAARRADPGRLKGGQGWHARQGGPSWQAERQEDRCAQKSPRRRYRGKGRSASTEEGVVGAQDTVLGIPLVQNREALTQMPA